MVVIELKRDEIGAHMELQALRYAAMISTMSLRKHANIIRHIFGSMGSMRMQREVTGFCGVRRKRTR